MALTGLDFNFFRLRLFRFGQRETKHAVAKIGLDLILVDNFGQGKLPIVLSDFVLDHQQFTVTTDLISLSVF